MDSSHLGAHPRIQLAPLELTTQLTNVYKHLLCTSTLDGAVGYFFTFLVLACLLVLLNFP